MSDRTDAQQLNNPKNTAENATAEAAQPVHAEHPLSAGGVVQQKTRHTTRKLTLGFIAARDIPPAPFKALKLERDDVIRLLTESGGKPLDLRGADMRGTDLKGLNMPGVIFGLADPLASDEDRREYAARLDNASLAGSNLAGCAAPEVVMSGADLRGAVLFNANFEGANCSGACFDKTDLHNVSFERADLSGASFIEANCEGAHFVGANLQNAHLKITRLRSADFSLCNLTGADLQLTVMDEQTFFGGASLNEARFDGARLRLLDLTVIDWRLVKKAGEEIDAQSSALNTQQAHFRAAARVYRQLASALQGQGLIAEARRFGAQSKWMDCHARWNATLDAWRGRRFGALAARILSWLSSASQGIISGYGRQPLWIVGWSLLVVGMYAGMYAAFSIKSITGFLALAFSARAFVGFAYTNNAQAHLIASMQWLPFSETFLGLLLLILWVVTLTQLINE